MGADGVDLLGGEVELTEFTEIDVESVKGVRKGASGVPILLMKGLAEPVAKGSRDCTKCGHSYDADSKADNCEDCGTKLPDAPASKAADDGDSDDVCKTCKGKGTILDGNRDCPDCDGPAKKSLPAWHSPAALLVRLARENPGTSRGDLFKAVTADGTVDEQPDIDGGQQAIALIAKLIGYEADELGAGDLDEIRDIGMLCDAASTLKWWIQGEQAGQDQAEGCGCPPDCSCCMGMVMASTDDPPDADELAKSDLSSKQLNDLPDSAFAFIEDGGSKDSEGKTTPRKLRHFAIHDKAHADAAASRIAGGAKFGDQAKAKVEAAQKKFGETSDASKSTLAEGEGGVQTDGEGTGSQALAKAVKDAVAEAMTPVQKELGELRAFKAKVEALPVPGGPVMSAVRANTRAQGDTDLLAKAAYYREKAETVTDPADRAGYRQLARETEAKAKATTA